MNSQPPVQFGRAADDYRRHRAGFPDAFFERIANHGVGVAGQRLLDLGTGTGTLARGFALRGAEVTGLDLSGDMLAQAQALDAEAGVTVGYVTAAAEETDLDGATFDTVTAGQCWHWFDRPRAAAECLRVLRPGGTLAIAHFDWLPLPGNVVEASETLIRQHNPDWTMWGGTGIYRDWLTDMAVAGFEALESFSFDVTVPYSHEAWRGRIRASAGVGASLPENAVDKFDAAHGALLQARFPDDPLAVPHRVFAAIGRKPGTPKNPIEGQ
ncbi:MAG: methyltransferase domain-containing protein [Alphaproteobacteria bacterium]|nr:methyltransferase domain-containing protein [Alphaproteobacteria bacterium]